MTSGRLRRLQWAVRAALTLGVAASVTANILHARDNPISQTIAAWPPLALLITVELVSRIPIVHRWLGIVRVASTAAIAAIAAWVSYWHMAGVVARYGETGTVPYLLPLSVDGLIIVASVSLVELGARLRDTTSGPISAAARTTTTTEPTRASATGAGQPAAADRGPTARAPADQEAAVLANQTQPGPHNDRPSSADPATEARPEPAPDREGVEDHERANSDDPKDEERQDIDTDDGTDLAPDLLPLMLAARTARDELVREGRTVSRDALARRLRRNGHAVRNNRVSDLLNALRQEKLPLNGASGPRRRVAG
ncbi:DUF2637 domain-containing protein [Nucisporomicrobium flavum]|uniref:DUF2637 domain-containing protein n=1 Tax=Nucisporomicrobium flavum TaxID=2785915 RepID=UPI003C2D1126